MEKNKLKTVSYQVKSPELPKSFHGFRVGVLSDLHNCRLGEANRYLLDLCRKEKPDCFFLAGDWITEEKLKKQSVHFQEALDVLEQMIEIAPVYYGMGNHEQRWKEKGEGFQLSFEEYRNHLEALGVVLLDNQSCLIHRGESSLRITGLALPNTYYSKTKRVTLTAEEITSLTGPADKEHFQILLAHTPQFYSAYMNWGADLALAGHYHGGVIRIPGLGGLISTNFRLFPRYDHGRYEKDGREMIVTSGLGCHTIPVRWNNPPEMVILEFVGE
ncbi:MAG: metallophosphoesterase [Clostridiales bacterium]|nr:metallophosphoesterase [Clostridiales bacterium]